VDARERCGKEWLILAVCAGRTGDLEEAGGAARTAAWLDPTLPEAFYLSGLYDWRAGRHAAAQQAFRAAVALDSSYREPALALVRSRLPGVPPDTLPTALLTGVREVGLLTSPARPKREEFVQADVAATILHQEILPLPDSLRGRFKLGEIYLPILVDERGRAALHELPWSNADQLPDPLLRVVLESLREWRFTPAVRLGKPQRAWANIRIALNP
jgi:tetratricopeptide (TPR) repeat protein